MADAQETNDVAFRRDLSRLLLLERAARSLVLLHDAARERERPRLARPLDLAMDALSFAKEGRTALDDTAWRSICAAFAPLDQVLQSSEWHALFDDDGIRRNRLVLYLCCLQFRHLVRG